MFHDLFVKLYTLSSRGEVSVKEDSLFFVPRMHAEIGSLASIRISCVLELENRKNQTFSRTSKQRISCLGDSKHLVVCEA